MQFTMQHCTASLVNGTDMGDLKARGRRSKELSADLGEVSRVVGLFMLVPAETDAAAQARVDLYNAGADEQALTARAFQYSQSAKAFSKSENLRRQMRHMRSEDGSKPIAVSKASVVGSVETCVDKIVDVVEGGQFDWICCICPTISTTSSSSGKRSSRGSPPRGIAREPGSFSPLEQPKLV